MAAATANPKTPKTKSRSDKIVEELETSNRIVDWDDGFTPSGCDGAKCRMVADQPRSRPGLVAIREDVVPKALAQSLYDSALGSDGVWGEYVSMEEIESLHSTNQHNPSERRHLAAEAVHYFFRETFADLMEDDWKDIHGVSVWVIASGVGNSVQYHIDYAEMFRYQTNVIYPPMYGGTLHLTPTKDMEGGGFYAHRDGLDHYQTHKYKCPLKSLGWDGSSIKEENNNEQPSKWVEIPYKYNQGTLCDGDLPHFSAPVRSIPEGLKRVIVGFNVCNHEIGPIAQEYPEHSAKFNKFVKLSQTAAKNFKGGLTVEACKSNPKLAAFIKLLAKTKKELDERKAKENKQQNDENTKPENSTAHDTTKEKRRLLETEHSKENNGVARA